MTEVTPWVTPGAVRDVAPETPLDIPSMLLAEHLRDSIWMAAMTTERAMQVSIGASEIGSDCDRQIAYREAGTPAVNFADPLRAMVGIGVHLILAEHFRRLDGGSGRYLVEHRCSFRGVPGVVDLYDRRIRTVVDWKSPLKEKIRLTRKDGPSTRYITQVHIYGAALREQGEQVERVALAFLPADGKLNDLHVWSTPLDVDIAEAAVKRREQIAANAPEQTPAHPSRLCPWCAHYRPGSGDLTTGCPGNTKEDTP